MTAKRKDSGDLEIVRWGMGTNGFRVALLVLVLSMHPLGRGLLSTFGFKFADDQKITVTNEQAGVLTSKVDEITKDLTRLKDDVREVKSNVSNLQNSVTGFQVDFERYKPKVVTPPTNLTEK